MITPFGELPNHLAVDMSLAEQHEWLTRRVRRRSVLKTAGLGGLAVALPQLWMPTAAAASSMRGAYGRHIAYGADPATQMWVSFAYGSTAREASVVATTAEGHQVMSPAQLTVVRGSAARYGHSLLKNLRPRTFYAYEVFVDGNSVTSGTFTTADPNAHAFRFTAFGDQGATSDARSMAARVKKLDPQLHLYAGDIAYADRSGRGGPGDIFHPQEWDKWLVQNDPYVSGTPWMFAVGNHDMEPGFDRHGYAGVLARLSVGGASPLTVPTATQYRVGNVGFVGLDSNDVSYEFPANRGWTDGAQTAWLEQTLRTFRAPQSGVDFIVAYMHHTAYSTNQDHGCEGGVRESWLPPVRSIHGRSRHRRPQSLLRTDVSAAGRDRHDRRCRQRPK